MRLCLLPFYQDGELPPHLNGLGGVFLHAVTARLHGMNALELVSSSCTGQCVREFAAASATEERSDILVKIAHRVEADGAMAGAIEVKTNGYSGCIYILRATPRKMTALVWKDLETGFFAAVDDTSDQLRRLFHLASVEDPMPTSSLQAYIHFFHALGELAKGKPTAPSRAFWQHLLCAVAYDPSFEMVIDLVVFKALRMLRTRSVNEAEETLNRLHAIIPNDGKVAFALAEFALMRADHSRALQLMQDALSRQPGFAEGYLRLALYHQSQGESTLALEALDRLPGNQDRAEQANLFDLRGAIHAHGGRIDEAIACWQRALSCDPSRATILSNLGLVMESCGDLARARFYYEGGLAIAPEWWGTYYNYGSLLRRLGDLGAAGLMFRRALELNPDHAASQLQLGQVLIQLGDSDAAEEAFLRALQLAAEHETRVQALAGLDELDAPTLWLDNTARRLARAGLRPRVLFLLLVLILVHGCNWRLWWAIGRGWEERGRWRLALLAYRRSFRRDPNQIGPLKALGLLLAKHNLHIQAARFLRMAAEGCPNDAEICKVLRCQEEWLVYKQLGVSPAGD